MYTSLGDMLMSVCHVVELYVAAMTSVGWLTKPD